MRGHTDLFTYLSDSFSLLAEAQALTAELLDRCDELTHIRLAQPAIVCVLTQQRLTLRGHAAEAVITDSTPRIYQPHSGLYEFMLAAFVGELLQGASPDYLIFFDAVCWQLRTAAGGDACEALVFHELCHLQPKLDKEGNPAVDRETGRPKLQMVPHDYERFDAEIRRYGPVALGLEPLVGALKDGNRDAQTRDREAHRRTLRRAS